MMIPTIAMIRSAHSPVRDPLHLLGDAYGNGSHSHSNERHAVCPLSVPQSVRLFAHTIIGDSAQKGFRSIDR